MNDALFTFNIYYKKRFGAGVKTFFYAPGVQAYAPDLFCFVLFFILVFSYILHFNPSNRFVKKHNIERFLLNATEFLIFFYDIITFFILLENTLFIQPLMMFFPFRKYFICSLNFIVLFD